MVVLEVLHGLFLVNSEAKIPASCIVAGMSGTVRYNAAMSRIPQTFIDDVLNRVDIVEVIDARVPLKKRGSNYMACCPFHDEKTPSFTVSQNKQFYHCFGCGASGSAINFLMEYERHEFREAVEALAQQCGMELPQDIANAPREASRQPLYDVLQQTAQWYQQQLRTMPAAIDYLRQRGLDGQTAKTFGIGWAPDAWQGLADNVADNTTNSASAEKPQLQAAEEAGLLSKGQKDPNRYFDRFRARVMFPIRDARGRVVGFGGRVIGNDEPKYLNSPETPVFHKGRELYGLYEARQANRNLERVLIVEGYMDVVMLAQHGINYAVATLGTATTPEHLEKLFKVCDELIFCFDGDRAGRAAAWRALENVLPLLRDGRQAKFLFLPQGEDPDSMVQAEGAVAFETRFTKAQAATEYLLDKLTADCNLASLDGRAKLIETAKPYLSKLPQGALKTLAGQRLAELAHTDSAYLQSTLSHAASVAPKATQKIDKSLPNRTPMRHAMTLLLQRPELSLVVDDPSEFAQASLRGGELFAELLTQAKQAQSPALLLERFRDHPHLVTLNKLMASPWFNQDLSDQADADNVSAVMQQEWDDTLRVLRQELQKNAIDNLINKQSKLGLSLEEKKQLRSLISQTHGKQ